MVFCSCNRIRPGLIAVKLQLADTMPQKTYFKQFASKKRGKYQIRHIFPNQVYMTTSVSINKSTKNYIMALEYTEVGHAQGATAGGSARPWRNLMHSQEVNTSGQEIGHLTMTMATKNKQKLFIFFC